MAGRRKANGEGTIFQRADGRWCGSGYVLAADGTRKRICVYATTRREAADKLATKLADSNRGLVVAADPNLTVGDYLTAWLTSVARHRLRATTYVTYESLVRRFLIPGLGHRKLATLTVRDVRTFLDRIATVCQCCTWGWDTKRDPNHPRADRRPRCCAIGACCGKHIRPATIRYIRAVLSAALADGVREDILARNVASPVRLPTPRSDFQPFTAGEARRYLLAAAYHRHGPLFELALRTGLRQGELLGLRWDDIDLDAGHLYVRRTLARTRGGHTFQPVKTHRSARRIVLPRDCVTSLKRYRIRQDIDRREAGDTWKESGLVFTTGIGTPMDPAAVYRHHQDICDLADVRYIRFHDLRHTCATLLLEQGVDLVTIKDLLGHAQIHTTADVYSHVRLRMQRAAIESMGDALDSEDDPEADNDSDDPTHS
ncbi:integrase [Actinoplanes campanulatus]|uniref:Integrase n=1 Tax=Actinoplanes campanulatus TaxID=113559 RepID=A0A7W5ADS6_9ACTN|nr:site-specific integrase [Actinoplanes campanulatus]MBB3094100.1 integrase [Actinoplanes campanulatus]GGN32833.1 site-specific integrase [Actinoplanes campanulatus]GID38201.1 site-specific integrase [Actinoplanes campanulatus]